MKQLFLAVLFGSSLLLSAAEIIFQGVGAPWMLYSPRYSEDKQTVTTPFKVGGGYVGVDMELQPGDYRATFQYRFVTVPAGKSMCVFSIRNSGKSDNMQLSVVEQWQSAELYTQIDAAGKTRFGINCTVEQETKMEIRNFKVEKLSVEDYARMEYPIQQFQWFNRSQDRGNTTLTYGEAEDFVAGGPMVQVSANPGYSKTNGLLLMSLPRPLPAGHTYRLSCYAKSDKEGGVRFAYANHFPVVKLTAEWQKVSIEVTTKPGDKSVSATIAINGVSGDVRLIAVKDVVVELVK